MSTCGVCGGAVRAGTMVQLVTGTGELQRKRACGGCAKRGVLLVAPAREPVLTKTLPLDAGERDVREVLRRLARHLRGTAKAQKSTADRTDTTTTFEHAEGLEQAADIAEGWAARPNIRN